MKVYISGPMTGLPEFNYPAFFDAEKLVESAGYASLNPARALNGENHHAREAYMRADIAMVCEADGILLLPDWHKSRGARLEVQIASELGLAFFTVEDIRRLAHEESGVRESRYYCNRASLKQAMEPEDAA